MWRFGVGIGVDRDGADAEASARREHSPGDLAAVGHQDSRDHLVSSAISACVVALSETQHAEITVMGALTS
jgi:hypothetical protein